MRGKDRSHNKYKNYTRITPAYAGKSSICTHSEIGGKDHPRLCGEKLQQFHGRKMLVGSPPPMRGKVETCSFANCTEWDHPRLCGEKPECDC